MNTRMLAATFAATLTALAATAQGNCPRERATTVTRDTVVGNTQDCGGVSIRIGGVTVYDGSGGCPLFVIYEPEHSIAVPAEQDTMVELIDMVDVVQITFECQNKWFLLIPYDSTCRQTGMRRITSLPLLRTVPCKNDPS